VKWLSSLDLKPGLASIPAVAAAAVAAVADEKWGEAPTALITLKARPRMPHKKDSQRALQRRMWIKAEINIKVGRIPGK